QNGSSNQNSGSITVKRYSSALKRQDYTLWSSSVAGQQLQSFSPGTLSNRFYTYDTSADQYAAVATPSATNFATATGYLIRMPNVYPTTATVWTDGAFVGVPNSGDYNFTMVDGGSGLRFNLVGNPYPSPIDAADFVGNTTNATNTTGTLYFWRKTNNAASPSYCTWTTGGFVSNGEAEVYDPNGVIQTGQGFFVEGTGSGTTVAFNNTMRTDNHANQFFRTSSEVERHRIWLNATGADGLFSQTMVGYMSDATNGYDATIDGKYINDGSIALTSLIDATPYAIQGRSMPFDAADIVPMQFKAATAGTFSIAIDHVDGLFNGSQDIYLRDSQTGMDHDLKASAYTFSSEAGTFDTRFKLVYTAALSVDHPTLDANTIVIYKNENQSFTINSGAIAMASIKVFDIRGRMITTQNNINTTQATITAGQTNQVLLVQVTSVDGATVTKKVVR
ncbi:T9SS sorting signal type C domain-containing protein, partial [Flavobacterium sp.]|uniref:T9SS sorting signal type C domain-containing protein n=1 Tax=Flavobacterium sp. TaxID=239 RepID=UPI002C01D217